MVDSNRVEGVAKQGVGAVKSVQTVRAIVDELAAALVAAVAAMPKIKETISII